MTKILLLFLTVSLLSCNNNNPKKMATAATININNQGVVIDYTDTKLGDTVLLFIHGWGINKTYWADQVSYFAKKYRVVTVDLPGFGKSGKNRKSWTVNDYTEDIHALLTGLNLKNVILVGHSMSGAIIVETALQYPAAVLGVVGVDNLKDIGLQLTPAMEEEWSNYYNKLRKQFKQVVAADIKNLFAPATDTLVQKRVSTDILNADPTLAVDCLENLDKYPFLTKLQSFNKPLCLINSSYKPTDTLAFEKNKIKYHLLDMGATGHYPMIEKPNTFNLLLQKAIDTIAGL